MIQHAPTLERRLPLAKSDTQFLNPIDRAIRCVNVVVRQLGYPGIETQTLAWLEGRADATTLRRAILRLSRRWPVMASRLVDADGAGRSYWQFQPGAACPLIESVLPSDDPGAVLDHAGGLLSHGRDPTTADPIDFHLLHRPGGRDVLLLQYNHALMDNRAVVPLLQELERLSQPRSRSGATAPLARPCFRAVAAVPPPATPQGDRNGDRTPGTRLPWKGRHALADCAASGRQCACDRHAQYGCRHNIHPSRENRRPLRLSVHVHGDAGQRVSGNRAPGAAPGHPPTFCHRHRHSDHPRQPIVARPSERDLGDFDRRVAAGVAVTAIGWYASSATNSANGWRMASTSESRGDRHFHPPVPLRRMDRLAGRPVRLLAVVCILRQTG